MIMMRPNNISPQKVNKPPPPVPPRPNKSLVQEALAKTRQNLVLLNSQSKPPNRAAPPPPPPASRRPLIEPPKKSVPNNQTCTAKKQAPQPQPLPLYEQNISLDKVSSRPVVYQSDNVKKPEVASKGGNEATAISKKAAILKKVDSFKNEIVKKTSSLKRVNSKVLEKPANIAVSNKNGDDVKLDSVGGKTKEEQPVAEKDKRNELRSRNSTLDKSTLSSKTSESSSNGSSTNGDSVDTKKWDRMLNDRNHVNTLIDEMFASVLDTNTNKERNVPEVVKDANDNRIVISNKVEDDHDDDDDDHVGLTYGSGSGENLSTVIVISSDDSCSADENKSMSSGKKSNASTGERKVKFNDRMNHELLINELQHMKNINKRQRRPSSSSSPEVDIVARTNEENIHTNDWFGMSEEGKEVKMSSCHITIEDARGTGGWRDEGLGLDFDRITKMSHLHGLPPLPKSLSGFNFLDHRHQSPPTPVRTSSMRSNQGPQITPTHIGTQQGQGIYPAHGKLNSDGSTTKKMTNLDAQLAILRREMYSLRQQDLSLLSQLWSLNESIQDFRQMLQDQEDRIFSPPSPSPPPSSADDEEFYMSATSVGFKSMSGIPGRKMSGSSGASGSIG